MVCLEHPLVIEQFYLGCYHWKLKWKDPEWDIKFIWQIPYQYDIWIVGGKNRFRKPYLKFNNEIKGRYLRNEPTIGNDFGGGRGI